MTDDKIKIQLRLEKLSLKQLELTKVHQQKFFLYRWFQLPDPELQSVNDEISRLETRELEYLKILQAAANSPPPADWSMSPFYWKSLTKFGLITPAEQMGAFTTLSGGFVGLGYALTNFYRAYHLFQLTHCKEKSEEWIHHWARARATPQQIELASYWIERFRFRGFAALGAPALFVAYLKTVAFE